jgi:hypothetical protein
MNFEKNETKRPLIDCRAEMEIPLLERRSRASYPSPNRQKGGKVTAMGRATKDLLDLLPFDGDKTKIGTIGIGTSLLGLPIPVDPRIWIVTSVASFGLGLLHKWLKKKYPDVKWPEETPKSRY